MQITFYPIWPWPVVVLTAVGLIVLAHRTYEPGSPARRLLLTLRWIAIAIAVFALLRPTLVVKKTLEQSSSLVILADKSKSMTLRDMWDNQSRWQALIRLLAESESELNTLKEKVNLRQFVFGRTLTETATSGQQPDGEQTGIGDSLQDVQQRAAGERLAGIVLLTDGVNTTGVSPATIARQLGAQKVPIYAFGFGQAVTSEHIRDIVARTIVASPTVFAKNKMSVRAEFANSGFGNQDIPVRLKLDGVVKATGVVKPTGEAGRGVIDLVAVPERAGDMKVTIEADVQPGELLPGNNAVETYVTVLAGGVSVLHVEGKYRYWEPKFLRWALDRSPDIELTQMFLLDPSRQAEMPPDVFEPGKFDVYLLGDVNSNYFSPQQLDQLHKAVEAGAGLLMMGGYESFGAGGWGATPIADLLPVAVQSGDGQTPAKLRLAPTAAGLRHFILRLAGDDPANQKLWESLRPLDGANLLGQPKPGARLLAASPEGVPLLVEQDSGKSRSLAFAGDTTWRWRSTKDGIDAHARFWRQLVLWLAHKEEASGSQIRVKLARRRLAISQRLPVEVNVENADGTPLANAQVQALVTGPDGKQAPLELFRQGDTFRGVFWQSDAPGDYSIRVAATADGKSIGGKNVKFLVYDEDTELRQLAADHQLLRTLAESTGGEFHEPVDLPNFLRSMKDRDLNLEVIQPVSESLWDRWELLALFTLVVTLEWVIRKRRGLP